MSELLFLDVETGGTDFTRHSLLEVGMAFVRNGRIVDTYRSYVKQEEYIVTAEAMRINKIPLEYAYDNGKPAEMIMNDIRDFMDRNLVSMQDKPMLAGHNVDFDRRFLQMLYKNAGADFHEHFSYRIVDTATMIRIMKEADLLPIHFPNKLHAAAKYLNICFDESNAHQALTDVEITIAVYNRLLKIMKGEESLCKETTVESLT